MVKLFLPCVFFLSTSLYKKSALKLDVDFDFSIPGVVTQPLDDRSPSLHYHCRLFMAIIYAGDRDAFSHGECTADASRRMPV